MSIFLLVLQEKRDEVKPDDVRVVSEKREIKLIKVLDVV